MKENRQRIGEILIEAGLIDEMQLSSALGEQNQWGGRLCSIIINMGFASEDSIASALGSQLKQQCLSFDAIEIPPDVLKLVSLETARKYNIIPIEINKNVLTIAISDPLDLHTIDELSFRLGFMVKPILAIDSSIKNAIDSYYEGVPKKDLNPKLTTSKKSAGIETLKTGNTTPSHVAHERVLPKKEGGITPGKMAEALARILIEKGLITKEELMNKIRKMS